MIATDEQVQSWADTRVRPGAELIRALYFRCKDDRAAVDQVYQACAQQDPTWADNRHADVPVSLVPSNVLAFNAWEQAFIDFVEQRGDWALIESFCVRPVPG